MRVDVLDVYQADRRVGRLFDERPLRFVYDDAWLQWPDAHAISPEVTLRVGDHTDAAVHAFFENLLPEGPIRRFLQVSRHATTVFGLLGSVGGYGQRLDDTATGRTPRTGAISRGDMEGYRHALARYGHTGAGRRECRRRTHFAGRGAGQVAGDRDARRLTRDTRGRGAVFAHP